MSRISCLFAAEIALLIASLATAIPAKASDQIFPGGGTLAQVVDGGGTYSVITLVNLESITIPYTLNFYNDAGQSLTLSTNAGTNNIFTGTLNPGGSTIIRTNDSGSIIKQGYAIVTSQNNSCPAILCSIAGSVVFGIPLGGSPLAEASVPLDTGFDSIISLPFDQTTSNVGLAIVNSVYDAPFQLTPNGTATIKFNFYDQTGNNFSSSSMTLGTGQHTAFILATQFPQIAGKTGILVMQSTDQNGNAFAVQAVGLRVNLAGTTYTTITPIVPCHGGFDSTGYFVCTN